MLSLPAQFARPEGLVGWTLGAAMGIVNRPLAEWALTLIEPRPHDVVLEIGSGAGVALGIFASRVPEGRICGLDHSAAMARQSRFRNAEAIARGRVSVTMASAARIPCRDESFDKAFSINSVQYWPNLAEEIEELHRVLRRGGRLAIILRPRWAKVEAAVLEIADSIASAVRAVGFRRVERGARPGRVVTTLYVSGMK